MSLVFFSLANAPKSETKRPVTPLKTDRFILEIKAFAAPLELVRFASAGALARRAKRRSVLWHLEDGEVLLAISFRDLKSNYKVWVFPPRIGGRLGSARTGF